MTKNNPLPTYTIIFSNKGDKIGKIVQVKGLKKARLKMKNLKKRYDNVRIGRK